MEFTGFLTKASFTQVLHTSLGEISIAALQTVSTCWQNGSQLSMWSQDELQLTKGREVFVKANFQGAEQACKHYSLWFPHLSH